MLFHCFITVQIILQNSNLELDKHFGVSYNSSVAIYSNTCPSGGMADAVDSKSTDSNIVGVQVPSRALARQLRHIYQIYWAVAKR